MSAPTSMRALVVHGAGECALEEIERPTPGPTEVLLEVDYCGVCGTDLNILSGRFRVPALPLVIGHELAGRVVAVGSDVSHIQPGAAATVDVILPCGTCYLCRRGSGALCCRAREIGIDLSGGLADYVLAPGVNVYPLGQDMSTRDGAMVEPLACALHGQDRVDIAFGDTVAIVGGGAQGLLHTVLARLRGAGRVIVSALHQRRRERATALGADLVLDPEKCDPAAAVRAATEGRGADVVIEAAGSVEGYRDAVGMVRRGGRLLVYSAASQEMELPLRAVEIFERELSVVGSYGGTGDTWPRALELIAGGRVEPQLLVDREWPLSEAPAALRALGDDRSIVKGLIEVKASNGSRA